MFLKSPVALPVIALTFVAAVPASADLIELDDFSDSTSLLQTTGGGEVSETTPGVGVLGIPRTLYLFSESSDSTAQVTGGEALFSSIDEDFLGAVFFEFPAPFPIGFFGDGGYFEITGLSGDASVAMFVMDDSDEGAFSGYGFDIDAPGIYSADFSEFQGDTIDFQSITSFGLQITNPSNAPFSISIGGYGLTQQESVPEPGSAWLLAFSALAWVGRRGRRRNRY